MTCKRNKLGREGNSQNIEFDLHIDGGADFWSPLVRVLAKNYPTIISRRGGYYYWEEEGHTRTENTVVEDENGNKVVQTTEVPIDVEKGYREAELAAIIHCSTSAKELIRQKFEIPDLPPEAVIKQVEAENKKKRGKKRDDDEDEDTIITTETL